MKSVYDISGAINACALTYDYVNARVLARSGAGRRKPTASCYPECFGAQRRNVSPPATQRAGKNRQWQPTNTRHGYTGHEHWDKYALINMNGRVYDPVLGRFMSPDPYIQDAGNAQNFDRYSYVLNNPLKYVDPSGYLVKDGPGFRHWLYIQFLKIRSEVASWDQWVDPFTSDLPWAFFQDNSHGGGAPAGGSAASGSGNGGGGGTAPVLGGDENVSNEQNNEEDGSVNPPRLINTSDEIIWFKPDDDFTDSDGRFYKENEAYPLLPGHFTNVPIDGFTMDGSVYKISNGCTMVVVGNGDYLTIYQTPWGEFDYQIEGGQLNESPGVNWDDLFNKAKK